MVGLFRLPIYLYVSFGRLRFQRIGPFHLVIKFMGMELFRVVLHYPFSLWFGSFCTHCYLYVFFWEMYIQVLFVWFFACFHFCGVFCLYLLLSCMNSLHILYIDFLSDMFTNTFLIFCKFLFYSVYSSPSCAEDF